MFASKFSVRQILSITIMEKVKKIIRYAFYPLYLLYRRERYRRWMSKTPEERADILFYRNWQRKIDWENPRDLNEKIRWMQFNTNTDEWSRLADKYAAREYVREKGYEDILVKLYGKWDKAEDIDFDALPNSFILKTNHGCGEVIAVEDKRNTNLKEIRRKMKKYVNTPFGEYSVEPHYLKIKPCIIAEELLVQDGELSTSLIDYKFLCFHGNPVACYAFTDRNLETHSRNVTPYDMDWNKHEEWRIEGWPTPFKDIPRPVTLDLMKKACQDLASQFPFVRMDFYEVNGHLYFGEFTFTPAALSRGVYAQESLTEWGKLLELPNKQNE